LLLKGDSIANGCGRSGRIRIREKLAASSEAIWYGTCHDCVRRDFDPTFGTLGNLKEDFFSGTN
jgi:hypothetical protein